ncbi:MAG: T9SS type A sorting domain-containing protein [bacterium]
MRHIITILTILLINFEAFLPKSLASELGSAYEGKHFFIGFMQNEIYKDNYQTLQIHIVSNYPADIIVKVPNETDKYYSLQSDSILKIIINDNMEIIENESIVKKSVEIISTVPVLVYAFNSKENTSDCFTAVPVSQWGNEYVAMSVPNDQYLATFIYFRDYRGYIDSTYLIPRKSEFLILASEDDTRVEFIPKSITQSLRQKDQPTNVTLNAGDCYLVQSYDFPVTYGDLTGSIIKSDKPVGVISGHVRTAIPQLMSDYQWESKDHIAAMLTPTSSWGRKFYSVPFGFHDGGDLFRITCFEQNTYFTVETSDTVLSGLLSEMGDFAQFAGINKPAIWTSNNPVQIGQYMMRIGGYDDNYDYDPSLVILPPAEQFVQKMVFQTVNNGLKNPLQYEGYEIYLIADYEALNTLKLDDYLVTNIITYIYDNIFPDAAYFWVRLPITEGKHILTCDSGRFSGVAYGYGNFDSYALTLGSSLSNPFTADSISPVIAVEEYCGNISGTITELHDPDASGLLFAVMTGESYNYSFNLSPKIMDATYSATFTARPVDVMKDGKFVLEYRDKNGNGQNYTFNYNGIKFNVPGTISLGLVEKGDTNCLGYAIKVGGKKPVLLDSIALSGVDDNRFVLNIKTPLPAELYPGEEFEFEICFHPDSSFDDLNQKLLFYFDCNRYDSLMIFAMVRYPELQFIGYDFGEVCLGDTSWGEIQIINTGNVPAVIDSVYEIVVNSQFDIILRNQDGSLILPDTLRPGDILALKTRFLPLYKGSVERIVSVKNDLSISNEIKITGTGIAPFVNSILVDWGKRRVGSVNDTTVYLYNTGECVADISYNGSDGNTIPFMTDSISNIKDSIYVNDSLSLFLSFKPGQLQFSQLVSFFFVDSPGHDLVAVTKKGEGTLPVIVPVNIEFDTIPIFSYTDSLSIILQSKGNERLWIDFKSLSGDDSCFIINNGDLSILQNRYIEPDSLLIIPIRFNPQKLGFSEMAITLSHDAFPAFKTDDTLIYITGNSIEVDTLSPDISFEDNLVYMPCNDDELPVYIKNDGNVELSLDSLELFTKDIDAQWLIDYPLPIMLEPDTLIELKVKVFPKANVSGKLSVRAVFNDTIPFQTEDIEIITEVSPLRINEFGLLEYNIGDTGSMVLSGKFPHSSQIPVDFDIEIQLQEKYMYLMNKNPKLEIISGFDTVRHDLPLVQTLNKIFGNTKNEIIINDSCEWRLNLEFLCLLSDKRQTDIVVKANSRNCYSLTEESAFLNFLGVCSFNIRQVIFNEFETFDAEIYPNPANEELCIKINLYSDNWIFLSIFDQNGKKILQNENLYLKKGSHSLIFELMPMASGVYMLSVRTKLSMKNIKFIITK